MIKLDKYDKKLLYELDKNARESYVQLAKKVGLSKDTIKYRIDGYLQSGLLGGFYTLINAGKLGYYCLRIYFDFINTTPEKEEEIIHILNDAKEVFILGRAEGACQVLIGVWVRKLSTFHAFWSGFKDKYARYIKNERQSVFMELTQFNRHYFFKTNESQVKKVIREPEKSSLDSIDKNILEIMASDARIAITDICKRVQLTAKAVMLRIRNLEKKNIILGYKPLFNLEKIGYAIYKVDIMLNQQRKRKILWEYAETLPNMVHHERAIGGSDVELDFEVGSFEEFDAIIYDLKEKFGESIASLKYFRTLKMYKVRYMPLIEG